MKKKLVFVITLAVVLAILAGVFMGIRLFSGEDDWIKDSRGVWIKHGNPAEMPDYVQSQQNALNCALDLYDSKKAEGMIFNSQCLDACNGYAVDIVHAPRVAEDDLAFNQCTDYRTGKLTKFIELDSKGNIVRAAED
jgi:hypothetical protein